MKKKAFTILEITIVVVIVGILATVAYPGYRNVIEDQNSTVCKANLQVLQIALDTYVMEHDSIPGNLGQIPNQYIDRALAQVMQQKGAWRIKLARFIVDFQDRGLAYAQAPGVLTQISGGNSNWLRCPLAGPNVIPSYRIDDSIANMPRRDYLNMRNGRDDLRARQFNQIIYDRDAMGNIAKRHRRWGWVNRTGPTFYANSSTMLEETGSRATKFSRVRENW